MGRSWAWTSLAAGLLAVLLAAPWPLLAEGDLPRRPGTPIERAEGFLGAWRLEAARSAAERGRGTRTDWIAAPEGVDLMVGEHGVLWVHAAAPLRARLDPARTFLALWLASVAAAGAATAALGRALGLSSAASVLFGVAWAALPAFAERGLTGLGGLAPPTAPLAGLGILLTLTSGDRRAARAVGGGLLAGLSLAASLWIGPSAALASLLTTATIGLHAVAVRDRAASPGVVGVCAVVLTATLMFVGSKRVAERLDGLDPQRLALPVTLLAERASPRAPVGPSPWHPLWRERAATLDPLGTPAPEPAAPGGLRPPATELPPAAPVLPLTAGGLLLLALARRATRASAVGAVALLALAGPWCPATLAPSLWTVAAGWAAGLGAWVWDHGLGRPARIGLAALLALELALQPFPGGPAPPQEVASAVGASPVAGGVVEWPYVRESGPHLARQWTHRRGTPLRPLPAREDRGPASALAVAPTLAALLDGGAAGVEAEAGLPLEERLAAELDWLDVGHLLVERRRLTPGLEALLDRLPGWERGPAAADADDVGWWYRAARLWSADRPR